MFRVVCKILSVLFFSFPAIVIAMWLCHGLDVDVIIEILKDIGICIVGGITTGLCFMIGAWLWDL